MSGPEPDSAARANQFVVGDEAQTGGIIVIGPDLTIISANGNAAQLLDVRPELLAQGQRWEDFIRFAAQRGDYGPGDPEAHVRRVIDMTGRGDSYEISRVRPDGAVIEVVGIPLVDGGFVSRLRDISEERRRRNDLVEASAARRRYRQFFEMSHELLGIAGADGRLHTVNDCWTSTLGWSSEELTARPFVDFVEAHDMATVRSALRKLESDVPTQSFTAEFCHRDGGLHCLEWHVTSSENGDLFCVVRDITQARQAAEAMENARVGAVRMKLRLIDAIESLSDGFVLFDRDDQLAICNEAYREPFGARARDIREGMSFEELLRLAVASYPIAAAVGREEEWIGERVAAHRELDGLATFKWGDGYYRSVERRTREGGIVTIRSDVTAIRQAENRLVDAIESMEDGFVLFDADDRLVICNDAFRRIHSEIADRIAERMTFEALMRLLMQLPRIPGDTVRDEVWLAERLRLHALASGSGIVRRQGGRSFQVSERRTQEGGIVTVLVEITAHVQREKKLEETIRDLETAKARFESQAGRLALLAERYQEEKTRAEDAMRVKADFLATMSHEIRTPLNGVVGMTGLLLETNLDDRQRQFADTISQAGDTLLALVNDILDFSKLEAGQVSVEEVEFDTLRIVEDTVDLLALRTYGKDIDLLTYVDPQVPKLLAGDSGRIRQILANLVGNAIKFTESGSVLTRVTVPGGEESADGVTLEFEVLDTGIGIQDDVQPRLFSRFTQADSSTTRRFGGTGLGLAISRELTELMGGTIGVDSRYGEGSRFWFRMPLRLVEGVMPEPAAEKTLSGFRVLIVDDAKMAREVVAQYASDWGIAASTADSGADAIATLERAASSGQPFDAVIVDHGTSNMSGVEFCRLVRALPPFRTLPMMLIANRGTVGVEFSGFDAVVVRPIRAASLFEGIVGLLKPKLPGSTATTNAELAASSGSMREMADETSALPPLKILLAEDNAVNQKLACALLERFGHRIETVDNGARAVTAVAQNDYDVVLMDIQMPELDGVGATLAIRALDDPIRAAIPIIAMTANTMPGDREKYLAAGMNDYVAKPVDRNLLNAAIDRVRQNLAGSKNAALNKPQSDKPVSDKPMPNSGLLNKTQIEELVDTVGLDAFAELAKMAMDDVPASLAEIGSAIDADDFERVRDAAHNLKSTLGSYGIDNAHRVAAELELACRNNETADAADILVRLQAASADGMEALKLFIRDSSQTPSDGDLRVASGRG